MVGHSTRALIRRATLSRCAFCLSSSPSTLFCHAPSFTTTAYRIDPHPFLVLRTICVFVSVSVIPLERAVPAFDGVVPATDYFVFRSWPPSLFFFFFPNGLDSLFFFPFLFLYCWRAEEGMHDDVDDELNNKATDESDEESSLLPLHRKTARDVSANCFSCLVVGFASFFLLDSVMGSLHTLFRRFTVDARHAVCCSLLRAAHVSPSLLARSFVFLTNGLFFLAFCSSFLSLFFPFRCRQRAYMRRRDARQCCCVFISAPTNTKPAGKQKQRKTY